MACSRRTRSVLSLGVSQVVGQDLADDPSGERGVLRVVVKRADENLHCLPDGPAASPGPGSSIDRQPFFQDAAALAAKKRPGYRRVAGRIADSAGAEIDDRRQPPVLSQQVVRLHVAVEPHRWALPGSLQCRLPDLGGKHGVDVTLERVQRFARLAVIDRQRAAAEEVVRSGRRPACRVDPVQGGEEVCQVGSELKKVTNCMNSDKSTDDPPIQRPWPGETASQNAYRQRLRYRQWQLASQDGKPALLLLNRRDIL